MLLAIVEALFCVGGWREEGEESMAKKNDGVPETPHPFWLSRIVELRTCLPSELVDHPLQHKIHDPYQEAVLRGHLNSVGITNAIRMYTSPATGLATTLDGHLRRRLGETPWPTLVLDITDEEAAQILVLEDEMPGMAEKEKAALARLLETVRSEDAAVQQMLSALAEREGIVPSLAGNVGGEDKEPPEEFPVYDEDIPVEHTCPKCGYEWSGKA
jgi:hypothetical protein